METICTSEEKYFVEIQGLYCTIKYYLQLYQHRKKDILFNYLG